MNPHKGFGQCGLWCGRHGHHVVQTDQGHTVAACGTYSAGVVGRLGNLNCQVCRVCRVCWVGMGYVRTIRAAAHGGVVMGNVRCIGSGRRCMHMLHTHATKKHGGSSKPLHGESSYQEPSEQNP